MSRILALLITFGTLFVFAVEEKKDYSPYPIPYNGYVTDKTTTLSEESLKIINKKLLKTETDTKVEIVLVIIDSMKNYPGAAQTIEKFASGLFNKYGIGNLPKNNGVLFLVSMKDRKMRLELGKFYGNTWDKDAQKIVDIAVKLFKDGKYEKGILKATDLISKEFTAHTRRKKDDK